MGTDHVKSCKSMILLYKILTIKQYTVLSGFYTLLLYHNNYAFSYEYFAAKFLYVNLIIYCFVFVYVQFSKSVAQVLHFFLMQHD